MISRITRVLEVREKGAERRVKALRANERACVEAIGRARQAMCDTQSSIDESFAELLREPVFAARQLQEAAQTAARLRASGIELEKNIAALGQQRIDIAKRRNDEARRLIAIRRKGSFIADSRVRDRITGMKSGRGTRAR